MHANHVRLSYSNDDGRSWAPSFTPYYAAAQKERLFVSLFQMPGTGLGLIWLEDDSALATWIEVADGRSQFRARRVSPDGQRSPPVTIAGLAGSRAGGSPRVARHRDELVFAWTESSGDTVKLQTAVARLSNPMR